MEWKIGEIKQIDGEWYQCLKSVSCEECAFLNSNCENNPNFKCTVDERIDNCSVIFKKLEKVGEPYFIKDDIFEGGKVYVQNFKVYEDFEGHKPICNDYIIYDGKNKIISIKIKQAKEGMEDNRTINQHFAKSEQIINDVVRKCYTENKSTQVKDKEKYKMYDAKEDIPEFDRVVDKCLFGEDKLNLKPFSLEAAKQGKPVCTRDGAKARILCFDAKSDAPIIALITTDDGTEIAFDYLSDGTFFNSENPDNDLMMLPEKKEGWVNVYKDGDNNYRSTIYTNEKVALSRKGSDCITTIKISWEE